VGLAATTKDKHGVDGIRNRFNSFRLHELLNSLTGHWISAPFQKEEQVELSPIDLWFFSDVVGVSFGLKNMTFTSVTERRRLLLMDLFLADFRVLEFHQTIDLNSEMMSNIIRHETWQTLISRRQIVLTSGRQREVSLAAMSEAALQRTHSIPHSVQTGSWTRPSSEYCAHEWTSCGLAACTTHQSQCEWCPFWKIIAITRAWSSPEKNDGKSGGCRPDR
jgi:hypothetical protein